MRKLLLISLITSVFSFNAKSQQIIRDVIISTDSVEYSLKEESIALRRRNYLYLVLNRLNQEVEVTIKTNPKIKVDKIQLVPTPGFEQLDSVVRTSNNTFVVDIQCSAIFDVGFPKLLFKVFSDSTQTVEEIKLYPFIFPTLKDLNQQIEIFNSQEITLPLPITNPTLIKYTGLWQSQGNLDYRLIKTLTGPSLAIKPNALGMQSLTVGVESIKPFMDENGSLSTKLFDFRITVRVVRSKFNYLNFTEPVYFFEPRGEKAITVWFDYNPNIKLNKTYRIEDQEGPGGRLIGEIYTRAYVENQNKVIGSMRTYALHQVDGGLLYVKEGDRNRFFTNFNILPKPFIEKISILRQGKEWTDSPIVYPGEEVELKIQGTGLSSSLINFADGKYPAKPDTIRKNNQVRFFTLKIPKNIKERSIPVSLNQNTTSFELLVNEYQRPRKLDFITVNYGEGEHALTSEKFYKPALYDGEIGDVVIKAHTERIDDTELYGVQFINIEIRLWDKNNRQIETRRVEDIKLVPDKSSVRNLGYDHDNETASTLRVNEFLVNKTYDLRPWSKIEITVEHNKSKYNGNGLKSKAIIYRSDKYAVDIEVSFPAGLFVAPIGNTQEVSALSGLSIATMANFTFYKKGQVKKEQPLRLGVGFIALNAINSITSSTDNNDIGAVALMSFQPLHSESKINFPLYAGFGYLFKANNLFLLIGPGIKFTF